MLEWNEYGFSWIGNFYWDQVINDTDSHDPSRWDTDWKHDWSTEFVAHLGFGSHLEDDPPGSSPPGVIYLFSGALIYLTTQLTRPGVVADKIAKIIQSRQAQGGRNAINALLISIEHVVLVSISQTNQIAHIAPLPLFNLRHTSTTASARYPASYLDAVEKQVLETHERQKVLKQRQAKEMLEAVKRHNPRA